MKQPVVHRMTPPRPGIRFRSLVRTRCFAVVPVLFAFLGLISFFVFALASGGAGPTAGPLAGGPPPLRVYDSHRLQADARTLVAVLRYLADPELSAITTNQLPVQG